MKSTIPHIGILGRRNAGKSSFINKITAEKISIVSDVLGTTTDPVHKTIELSKIGPVVLTDTAGIDDEGELGPKRIEKTYEAIKRFDLAILIIYEATLSIHEKNIIQELEKFHTPYFVVFNKCDINQIKETEKKELEKKLATDVIRFSSVDHYKPKRGESDASFLIDTIDKHLPEKSFKQTTIVGDLISQGDLVLLVAPIDIEAPKGRIILPQVQTIRDVLDNDAVVVMLKERELDSFMRMAKKKDLKISLVVTDSQCFSKVDGSIPSDIPLTSFSILFSRLKGDFDLFVEGTLSIKNLKENDNILILESCSHHVTGDDIGRVKIPRWLAQYTGKNLNYEVSVGLDKIKRDIKDYSLVVQCGGCMLTRKQILNRIKEAVLANIPVTNYGMTISYCHGIFERAVRPFGIDAGESLDADLL